MIKAVVIDDEQHCIDRLLSLLQGYCSEIITVQGTFQSIESGLAGIRKLQPEVVFLDVQLHDKTGFDLLSSLKDIHFEIIFTTAYEKYAVQAFKFSAIEYLLKPIDFYNILCYTIIS